MKGAGNRTLLQRRLRRWVEAGLCRTNTPTAAIEVVWATTGTRYFPRPLLAFGALESPEGPPICIEGYPRSGNSFAAASAALALPRHSVYSNTHSRLARSVVVRAGGISVVPCRDPVEAVASLIVFSRSPDLGGISEIAGRVQVADEFRRYEWLLQVRPEEQAATIYVAFSEITSGAWLDPLSRALGAVTPPSVPSMAAVETRLSMSSVHAWHAGSSNRSNLPNSNRKAQLDRIRTTLRRDFPSEVESARRALRNVWASRKPFTVGACPIEV